MIAVLGVRTWLFAIYASQWLRTACNSHRHLLHPAKTHVEALVRRDAGGRRYVPCAEERYSYELARWIMQDRFGETLPVGQNRLHEVERPKPKDSYELDWRGVKRELGVKGRGFEETVVDFVGQMLERFPRS